MLLFVLLVKADLGKIMFFFFDNWSAKCCFRTLKALFEVLEFFNYSAVYLILLSTGFADVDLDLLKEGLGDLDKSFFDVVILLGCCIFLIFFYTKEAVLLEIEGSLKNLLTVATCGTPKFKSFVDWCDWQTSFYVKFYCLFLCPALLRFQFCPTLGMLIEKT